MTIRSVTAARRLKVIEVLASEPAPTVREPELGWMITPLVANRAGQSVNTTYRDLATLRDLGVVEWRQGCSQSSWRLKS